MCLCTWVLKSAFLQPCTTETRRSISPMFGTDCPGLSLSVVEHASVARATAENVPPASLFKDRVWTLVGVLRILLNAGRGKTKCFHGSIKSPTQWALFIRPAGERSRGSLACHRGWLHSALGIHISQWGALRCRGCVAHLPFLVGESRPSCKCVESIHVFVVEVIYLVQFEAVPCCVVCKRSH
jgi:hypothetical protein